MSRANSSNIRSIRAKSQKRFRTLASLLDAQPKGFVKDPRRRLLWDHFMASEKLQKLRISPQCYRLLNEAKIRSDNLDDFYKTYRVPSSSFFPLFLTIKFEWFEKRKRWQERRDAEIFSRVKELPDHRKRALRILAEYERINHPAGDNPIWECRLFPTTKKRTEELMLFNEDQWYQLWKNHLSRLSMRYRNIPSLFDGDGNPTYSSRLLAVLVLRCVKVDRREISQNFRFLSKKFHPDKGGNPKYFRRIKTAKDTLLSEKSYAALR